MVTFGSSARVSRRSSWSGHDQRASGAAAQCGLINQEPHHRRGGRLTGEDRLPGHPRGEPFRDLLSGGTGERPQLR